MFSTAMILFIFMIVFSGNNAEPGELKLDLIQVLIRHGDRTPRLDEIYPKAPAEDLEIYEKYGYGQLTPKGHRRMHELGKMLREKYDSFLGDYKAGDVMAISTNYDRTVNSLQQVLSALYPLNPHGSSNIDSNGQFIPIYTVVRAIDGIFDLIRCSEYQRQFNEIQKTIGAEILLNHTEFIKYVEKNTGSTVESVFNIQELWFLFEARLGLGLSLPTWCNDSCQNQVKEFSKHYYNMASYTTEMKKYRGGTILKHFVDTISSKKQSLGENRKLHVYVGHDSQIAAVTKALNLSNHQRPKYGSAFIVEKFLDQNGGIFLKFGVFNDENQQYYQPITVLNCSSLCPFDQFRKLINEMIPSAKEVECKLREITPETAARIMTIEGQIEI